MIKMTKGLKSYKKMPDEDKTTIKNAIADSQDWLNAFKDDATIDEIEYQLKQLQDICDPLIKKMYGEDEFNIDNDDDDEDLWKDDL